MASKLDYNFIMNESTFVHCYIVVDNVVVIDVVVFVVVVVIAIVVDAVVDAVVIIVVVAVVVVAVVVVAVIAIVVNVVVVGVVVVVADVVVVSGSGFLKIEQFFAPDFSPRKQQRDRFRSSLNKNPTCIRLKQNVSQ